MTPDKPLLPGATIGVMGGGQLGRMFAIAARRMGYRVHTFSPAKDGPAAQLSDCATAASYDDEEAVMQFARSIDVLTFEFENIPAATIEWAARAQPLVRPRGEVLLIAQNRLREKEFLFGAGFPVARFRRVASAPDLTGAVAAIGRPAILKGAAFGYDGKGQQRIDPGTDLAEIWAGRTNEVCVLEQVIDFEKEISVLVARGRAGETAVFPVCENIHRNHILDVTIAPARIERRVAKAARELACAVAVSLDLVGLLAVEMFVSHEGELIINELAPRPHNSGHWTIEGCATSQFEQHVRAVCGLPLGATGQLRAAAMVNLLGDLWSRGEPNWREALRIPGARLHLYGKDEPCPRRKMGHLTVTAPRIEDARERALRARTCLTSPAARYTTEVIQTRTLAERDWAVSEAVALLRAGEAIALPTETVYGLAADATNPAAIEKIFEAKERPRFDPLIVHLPHADWLERFTIIEESGRELTLRLCAQFWPGPFTLVLPRKSTIPDGVTGGRETVAVRVSAHPVFSEIIAQFKGPLAAPSANRFGRISPTTVYHVAEELDGRIPLIVDAGPTLHGLESTIVAVRDGAIHILRRGMITPEQLAEFGTAVFADEPTEMETAGQLPSHYAPRTPLTIVGALSEISVPPGLRYGALLWSDQLVPETFVESRRLSARGNLREAAANLFRLLRELDRAGLDCIVAEAVPEEGLGVAIMDRLRRAAHT